MPKRLGLILIYSFLSMSVDAVDSLHVRDSPGRDSIRYPYYERKFMCPWTGHLIYKASISMTDNNEEALS